MDEAAAKAVVAAWNPSGPAEQRIVCPSCGPQRKYANRKDRDLCVADKGDRLVWTCQHCGWSAAYRWVSTTPTYFKKKEPALPTAHLAQVPVEQEGLSDAAVATFKARGISLPTLLTTPVWSARGKTEATSNQEYIHFGYRPHDGGGIYATKIRPVADKKFWQYGTCATFWLGDQTVEGEDLIIVEGEMDALAIREAGHFSVVSIPNGAPPKLSSERIDPSEDRKFSYVWDAAERGLFKRAKKIIIATDADAPGTALATELARRIGKARVHSLAWPEGCKDANDYLMANGPKALAKHLETAEPWPITGIYDAKYFGDQTRRLFENGMARGESTGFGHEVDELLSVLPGQLALVTGAPGAGKSTWLNALAMNLATAKNWRWAIYSSETQPPIHIAQLASLFAGKSFFSEPKMDKSELDAAMEFIEDHFFFIHSDNSLTYQEVIDRLNMAVMRWGVRGVIVDPVGYLSRQDAESVEWAGQMLQAFRDFGVAHDCAMFAVAHPYKMRPREDGSYPVPKGYEVSGSSHYYNRPDIGLTIHRAANAREISQVHCWKARLNWIAKEGEAHLFFDPASGRFSPDPFNYIDPLSVPF